MMQLNLVLGENLEDLHRELEYQRSVRQPVLLKKICTSPTTTRNWNVNGLLEEVKDRCPLGAGWWSARAMATLRRSCRSHCLSPSSGTVVFPMNLRPHESTKLMATHQRQRTSHRENDSVWTLGCCCCGFGCGCGCGVVVLLVVACWLVSWLIGWLLFHKL